MSKLVNFALPRYFVALLVVVAAVATSPAAADSKVSSRRLRIGDTVKGAGKEERMSSLEWLRSGQSVDDVFKLLKFNDGVENLLTNPNVNTFVNYISRFSHQHPDQSTSLIKTFTAAYGDDVVSKMLQVAKQDPSTKARATKLQAQQMKVWRSEKLTPDDVFKLLKLDQAANNPLSNLNLDAWAAYLNLFNYLNPGRETTMLRTFTRAYGDDQLAKMLEAAKTVPGTEKIAQNLQVAQFNRWMMKGLNPDKVYIRIFKLDPTKGKTIPEPNQSILTQYHNFYKSYSTVK